MQALINAVTEQKSLDADTVKAAIAAAKGSNVSFELPAAIERMQESQVVSAYVPATEEGQAALNVAAETSLQEETRGGFLKAGLQAWKSCTGAASACIREGMESAEAAIDAGLDKIPAALGFFGEANVVAFASEPNRALPEQYRRGYRNSAPVVKPFVNNIAAATESVRQLVGCMIGGAR